MSRALATALLAFGLIVASLGPAAADLVIKLKDGSVVRVPVDADQVQSLSFEDAAPGAAPAEVPTGADAGGQTAAVPTPARTGTAGSLPPLVPTVPAESRQLPAPPIQVGPTRTYKVPSQAAKVALDGSVIEIDAGDYPGDVAVWPQSNLTIRGVGGLAHVSAAGNNAGGKAIWVFRGSNVTVDGIELSGCKVPDLNGAGIRFEGTDLIIRNSSFHDNEMGLLTDPNPKSNILIENSQFTDNTVDYQATGHLGHNIYVTDALSFTLRGSYVHGASIGHNVKTRAAHNYILYNRITDEAANSSYLIDVVYGGEAYVIGNVFQKSATADNTAFIGYATEGGREAVDASFYVVNNTAVSQLKEAVLVHNNSASVASVMNNVFSGGQALAVGPSLLQGNVVAGNPGLADPTAYDYRLAPGSPAIDAGVDPVSAAGIWLGPVSEYRHPLALQQRAAHGAIDAGAYEAGGG
jgi:hypothetical protein